MSAALTTAVKISKGGLSADKRDFLETSCRLKVDMMAMYERLKKLGKEEQEDWRAALQELQATLATIVSWSERLLHVPGEAQGISKRLKEIKQEWERLRELADWPGVGEGGGEEQVQVLERGQSDCSVQVRYRSRKIDFCVQVPGLQEKDWRCAECATVCSSSAALGKHLGTAGLCERKKRKSDSLVCPRCEQEFEGRGVWRRHLDFSPDCLAKKLRKRRRAEQAEECVADQDHEFVAEDDFHAVMLDHCYGVSVPPVSSPTTPSSHSSATTGTAGPSSLPATPVHRSYVSSSPLNYVSKICTRLPSVLYVASKMSS